MNDHVLGLYYRSDMSLFQSEVLLIHKNRPAWQAGKLNLPGGKVEEGETPEQAVIREFMEETGIGVTKVEKYGEMRDRAFCIHCFDITGVTGSTNPNPRSEETEEVKWFDLREAIKDPRLIPNLRVIISLI